MITIINQILAMSMPVQESEILALKPTKLTQPQFFEFIHQHITYEAIAGNYYIRRKANGLHSSPNR